MHWILWGPIAIVLNIVAYYHGKHDLRTLVRPTIQQWPENPVIEVPRPYEPQVFSQDEANNILPSDTPFQVWSSTETIKVNIPIQNGPLVEPPVATDDDPVANVLPLLILIFAILLFVWIYKSLVTLFPSTSYLRIDPCIYLGAVACPGGKFSVSYAA